ncbi:MAG: response regulator transcription factor [Burkholderiaceae bacterium]|nr:response regulator transcription factor [Burkholderiaceae bacterium]
MSQIDPYQPQVGLLVVQMPGMTGIELARHVSVGKPRHPIPPGPMPLVIFITAFEELAVEAFEVRAIDYLLAGARSAPARVSQRAVTRLPSDQIQAIDQLAKATNTRRRHLSVHERGRVILVPLEQVVYLKAELKYITAETRARASASSSKSS